MDEEECGREGEGEDNLSFSGRSLKKRLGGTLRAQTGIDERGRSDSFGKTERG
jgi:hypothetical protein